MCRCAPRSSPSRSDLLPRKYTSRHKSTVAGFFIIAVLVIAIVVVNSLTFGRRGGPSRTNTENRHPTVRRRNVKDWPSQSGIHALRRIGRPASRLWPAILPPANAARATVLDRPVAPTSVSVGPQVRRRPRGGNAWKRGGGIYAATRWRHFLPARSDHRGQSKGRKAKRTTKRSYDYSFPLFHAPRLFIPVQGRSPRVIEPVSVAGATGPISHASGLHSDDAAMTAEVR